jgi:FtsP/CotA-like multicopper oxidase with cupredoxin domain
VNQRYNVDSQLNGAFIVDEPGATPTDRIFVLGQWDEPLDGPATSELDAFTSLIGMGRGSFTINGRGWPLTERIAAEVGETFEWRWINPTTFPHPLHLHGHYFTVVATGSLLRETRLAPSEARQVVTERINQGNTMRIVATPERPGNWLFHCHLAAHMAGELRREPLTPIPSGEHHNHAEEGMAGMVLGVEVTGDGVPIEAVLPERRLTMALESRSAFFGQAQAGIGVTFSEGERVVAPQATPGPPLLLTRGQPVRITIENHLSEETSIHWHGMELDSYFDGVAGYSGTAGSATPTIPPGQTFEARFTPPRSGTFIYHTHMGDGTQLPAGLYGAMIVSDADRPFDPVTESIAVIGHVGGTSAGPGERLFAINGEETAVFRQRAGVPHRFRLINITGNNVGFTVTLTSPDASVEWRAVAKDGADLPPQQREVRLAHRQPVSVGETYDFEWTPTAPGPYWLEVRTNTGAWITQAQVQVAP